MRKTKIDFVITWVDDTDEIWNKEYSKYMGESKGNCEDTRAVRFRDWGLLKYWFRGVEMYAPWVNHIFFVTNGQIPHWLNTDHKKIRIVNHRDFICDDYLPTFNSACIEVNLHRIPNLSEHFVYFNDDMFITRKVEPEDFFCDGLPVDVGIENVTPLQRDKDYIVNGIMRNNTMLINDHIEKRTFLKNNWRQWFSPRNGRDVIRNYLLSPWRGFCGFMTFHLPTSFLKETFLEIERLESKLMSNTCEHKFRSKEDISQWAFQNWQIANGRYSLPRGKRGAYYEINWEQLHEICKSIKEQRYKMICLNDEYYGDDYLHLADLINDAFKCVLSQKSEYEE